MAEALLLQNGGGVYSSDATASSADVRSGKTYLGSDTNDDVGAGSMPEFSGSVDAVLNLAESYLTMQLQAAGYYAAGTKARVRSSVLGDALRVHVLEGKTFTNQNGVALGGQMIDRGAITHSLPANGSYTIPAGYHNGSGKVSQSLTTKTAQTYNTSKSDQEIAAGQYLNGKQTIRAVQTAGIDPANIKSGVSVKVGDAGNAGRIADVEGTFTADANAAAGDMLAGKTAYVNGSKVTGAVQSKSAQTYNPSGSKQTIAAKQYLAGVQTIAAVTQTGIDSAQIAFGQRVTVKGGTNTIFDVTGTKQSPTPGGSWLYWAGWSPDVAEKEFNNLSDNTMMMYTQEHRYASLTIGPLDLRGKTRLHIWGSGLTNGIPGTGEGVYANRVQISDTKSFSAGGDAINLGTVDSTEMLNPLFRIIYLSEAAKTHAATYLRITIPQYEENNSLNISRCIYGINLY